MFWKRKKPCEANKCEKANDLVKKIEGPLWGYMVTQRGITGDLLQNLRRVECESFVDGKPATMVRIFDPLIVENEGKVIDSYESLDIHRHLILFDGYYRGPQMTDIHIGKVKYEAQK